MAVRVVSRIRDQDDYLSTTLSDGLYLRYDAATGKFAPAPLAGTNAVGVNLPGGNLILAGGRGTGNAAPGVVKIQVATPGASGSALATLADVLTATNTGVKIAVRPFLAAPNSGPGDADLSANELTSYTVQADKQVAARVKRADGTLYTARFGEQQAALANTSGATLTALETEVNALKARLRAYGAILDPPFSPASVQGLVLWLDAGQGLFQSTGGAAATANADPVGQWMDQSGNARHGTQATTAAKPTLRLNQVNGRPALRFDGADDFFSLAAWPAGATSGELFLVVKLVADPPSDSTSGLWSIGASGSDTHFPYIENNIYDDCLSTVRKNLGDPLPSLSSAYHIYSVASAAGAWTARLDGATLFTTATNTYGVAASPKLGQSLSTRVLNGHIAEFFAYSSVLSAPDRVSVLTHLSTKYAIPVS